MASADGPANKQVEKGYVIDIDQGAETARLMAQDRLFTEVMGGLFPELEDVSHIHHLLDLGCGPGGWTMEVAYRYPDIGVVGVDINTNMLKYAAAHARVRRLDNISFELMDITQPFEIADGAFEMVNARFLAGVLSKAVWPTMLQECYRVLAPGGIIRLTEAETGISSSPALQELGKLLTQALYQQGRTFSADGLTVGIVHMMGKLLRDAGFEAVQRRPFMIISDFGSPHHASAIKECETTYALLKPYLTRSGVISEQEYDKLYHTMLVEIVQPEFVSVSFGVTTWGSKPVDNNS